jgi:hypothetical protein
MNIASIITPVYDKWRNVIADILERNDGYASADDIYKECCEVKRLFFYTTDAFAVVTVEEHPKDTRLHITLAGGNLEGFDKLDTIIGNFGRKIGASKATFIGRKGLARVMAKRGWKSPFVYMEKEIE